MIDADEVGYPTQGDLLHFIYNAAGVLPAKRDTTSEFGEGERRRVQKALERLAGEEGQLEKNFGKLLQQLAYLVAGYVSVPPVNLAMGEVLGELLDVYRQVFLEEGTYLSKRETSRWLMEDRLANSAAVAIARYTTLYGLRTFSAYLPRSADWYLPSDVDGATVSPLQKVMRWIYAEAGVSQTQFHYPDRPADESDTGRQRDLENAQNWVSGHHLPSATALLWTFVRGFAHRRAPYKPPGTESDVLQLLREEGARTALFVARCSTYLTREIEKNFGAQCLRRVCETFNTTLKIALEDTAAIDSELEQYRRAHHLDSVTFEMRQEAVQHWDAQLRLRICYAQRELIQALEAGRLTTAEINEIAGVYGRFPTVSMAESILKPSEHETPASFPRAVMNGMSLATGADLTFDQIDAYEAEIRGSGMDRLLPWMVPWLRFKVCYRREDDAQAWGWISQAYEAAKYRAGNSQYKLVNQYVEMAAKAGKRSEFLAGVRWARYIGSEIRWLRDKELSSENLASLTCFMKQARYPV